SERPRGKVGVGIHEAGRDEGAGEVEPGGAGWHQPAHRGCGAYRPDPAALPPERVARDAGCKPQDPSGPEEAAPAAALEPLGSGAIHMWKTRQSEYPNGRLEIENG